MKPDEEIYNQALGRALEIQSKRGRREYRNKAVLDHGGENYRDS